MFIFSPSEAEKQPREPKIVFLIGKLTNEWSTLLFLILPHIRLIWEVCRRRGVPGVPGVQVVQVVFWMFLSIFMIFYNLYGRSVGAGVQGVQRVQGVLVVFYMFLSIFYDFIQLIWEVCRSWGCQGCQEGQACLWFGCS